MTSAAAPETFVLTCDDTSRLQYSKILCDHRYCSTPTVDLESFIRSQDKQEAWQQCRTAGYGLEEVNETFVTFADGECTRLEGLPLPNAAMLKASTTKYALVILPTESGGFGCYKYDDINDMEDRGEGGNKFLTMFI